MIRLSLILLILIAAPAVAGINLHLDMSAALPDSFYLDQSTAFKVTDHDGDGFFEIQAENDKMFATWSLQYNRTIDYFNKGDNGARSKYAAAYLDSDTLLDFVEFRNLYNGYDNNENIIIAHISTLDYNNAITQYIDQPPGASYEHFWYRDCDSLFYADADNDGEPELYARLKYQVMNCKLSPICDEYIDYFDYVIYILDNSYPIIDWLPYTDYKPVPLFNPDNIVNMVVNTSYSYSVGHYPDYLITRYQSYLRGYVDDQVVFAGTAPFEFECDEQYYDQYALFGPYWIDDIDPSTSGYEFATVLDQRSDGWSFDGTTETHCDLGAKYLACYNIAAADRMDTLWKIDITEQPDIKYIFADADFPGDLFTVQNNRLYLRGASDGQISDSSSEFLVSSDTVFAYSPMNTGGDPKLFTIQSGNLNIYDISITTGIDNPPQSVLPSSFTLGAPYPNPFNPSLNIPVELNSKSHLKIEVYNVAGQKVDQVADHTIPAGKYEYIWDGSKAASGVYFIKASTDDQNRIVKAVLLK